MMLVLLLAVPLAGAGALALRAGAPARGRRLAALHGVVATLTLAAALATAVAVYRAREVTALDGLLRADALSAWMVGLIGLVAGLAALEAPRYVAPAVAARFYALFHLFVFTMLLAVTTDDVGLMWVAIEGTTLASVFLVNFERTRASLEASYKYLLICSVGIALAFVGTVLVYFADVQQFGDDEHALRWTTLLRLAPDAAPAGRRAGLRVPARGLRHQGRTGADAHVAARRPQRGAGAGERPHVRRAALGRASTPCCASRPSSTSPPGPAFARRLLLVLGLVSMAVAALFLWAPTNFKRMLAYSSVEHIGHRLPGPRLRRAPGAWPARCSTSPTTPSPSPRSSSSPAASAPRTARRRSPACAACCAGHAR